VSLRDFVSAIGGSYVFNKAEDRIDVRVPVARKKKRR
jgi:hypothetical protein